MDKGLIQRALPAVMSMGTRMLAVAVLDANSVKKAVQEQRMSTETQCGRSPNIEDINSPTFLDKPIYIILFLETQFLLKIEYSICKLSIIRNKHKK